MQKDLTSSRLERQNVLNNDILINEVRGIAEIKGVFWQDKLWLTRERVACYYGVDVRTIGRYLEQNSDELNQNGYRVLRGKDLKLFRQEAEKFGEDINVPTKTTVLGVFDFKAFLNMGMLLSESENAKILRQIMLDILIDLINSKTGGGAKYINKRDKNFIFSSLQEENYRRKFTDALRDCVEEFRFKYAHFTDMIYVSIFKEKAKEYKKILDLQAKDKVRDTFYSEILDIISSYENGLSEEIVKKSEIKARKLTIRETEEIFHEFEKMALWEPIIKQGRIKMASRDMAFREAFHYRLSEYIQPLNTEEYNKFLGNASDELEKLMIENKDVLKRLKERE